MSLTPRFTLDDEYLKGMSCAICNNPNLTITHVEKYPDFVACNRCGAAFVVENEGSWVMYGKIPAEYPQTSQFALRQWTWLDAVAQRAADEREMEAAPSFTGEQQAEEIEVKPPDIKASAPSVTEEISPEQVDEVLEPSLIEDEIHKPELEEDLAYASPLTESILPQIEGDLDTLLKDELLESISDETLSLDEDLIPTPFEPIEQIETGGEDQPARMDDELFPDIELVDEKAVEEIIPKRTDTDAAFPVEGFAQQELVTPLQEQRKPEEGEESLEDKPSSIPIGEPEPDERFRVTIRGSQPKYPKNYCSHCLRTPVRLKAIMRASLPDPLRTGKRKLVPLDLPFCKDCQNRMNAQSEEERNARLLAFLISGLIALIAIVATMALGVINLSENPTTSLIVLLIVAILGFSIPLLIFLNRASRYPPPRDAAFVLSTLIVNESGDDLTEFEWRNLGYAELFRQVNQTNAIGEVVPIQDRVTFTEIPSVEIPDEKEQQPKPKPRKKLFKKDKPAADPHNQPDM